MPEINYKQKYQELKQKFKDSVDTAFRLGYEQGQNDAQMQQMQDQMAQQAALEQAAAAGQGQPGQPGQPGAEDGAPQEGGQPGDPAAQGGSELDQHISQLEGMLAKSELTGEDLATLKKSVDAIKLGIELRKSDVAVKSIAKALKTPKKFELSKTASINMNDSAKAAVTMQEKIVTDIMKAWESEETGAVGGIKDILAKEGLVKKG